MSAPGGNGFEARLEQAALWRTRRLEDAFGAADVAAFEHWLRDHPDNRAAYAQVERADLALDALAREPELISMRSAAFETARRASRARWAGEFWSTPLRVAALCAVLMIVALAAVAGVYFTPRVYETAAAERRVVALEDGSTMSLDASTVVRVRYDGAHRRFWLDRGRAKFDVAHDPLRPFTVTAERRTVVATGTSFSVELLNREVRVVLYEGRIAVLEETPDGRERPVRGSQSPTSAVEPGHELIAASDLGQVAVTAPIDSVRSRAWEAGQLVFDNEPMTTALARINRYTATQVSLGDSAVAEMHVSGVFTAGDTTAFVDGVTTLMPVRAVHDASGVTLYAEPSELQ
jgi:transmembrane sensor